MRFATANYCTRFRKEQTLEIKLKAFLSTVAVAAVVATPGLSQESVNSTGGSETVTSAEPWSYSITPFLWATGLSGTMSKGPLNVGVDADFKTIAENLDMGLMLDFRARRGVWEFGGNLVYADLSASKTGPIAGVESTVDAKLTILELDAKYYFQDTFFGYAGGRYINIDAGLAIGPPVSASASSANNWIDPIVGAGFNVPLSEKWSVAGKGDIGGFGLGSDFAWSAQAYAQYEASDSLSLMFGYRHLAFDYTSGSGTNLDLALSGPVFGLRIKF